MQATYNTQLRQGARCLPDTVLSWTQYSGSKCSGHAVVVMMFLSRSVLVWPCDNTAVSDMRSSCLVFTPATA